MALYKKKDYDGAIKFANELLTTHPKSVNTLYVMGLSACMLHNHELTISSFKRILLIDPLYKKNMYLFISIAYKKLNDADNAIQILSEAIEHFPNFYEAYIYRGKLYLKKREVKNSIKDFGNSIDLNSTKCSGYIGLGDCYRIIGEYSAAIQNYSIVITKEDALFEIIALKRAICYIEVKEYASAESDLDKILDSNSTNCEALYFKGFLRKVSGDHSQAIVIYEQAIKLNGSETATVKA
jgi:tetratricopeptide (TPR) repeat protein